ncbi:MAG TPA: porin family protein [Phnomibacter sp.]|nr:porin family protein [Phnomibacter sp.]
MRKVLLFSTTLFALVLSSQAQRLGVKAGYVNSTWGGDYIDADEKKSNNGFLVGLVGEVGLASQLYFQPHLQFVRKGVRVDHGDHMDNLNVSTVDLPLNLVYKTKGAGSKFFAGTGPQLGLNVGARAVNKEENENEKLVIGTGANADLKPIDFGWNFLAGIEMSNNLFLSANYALGIANQAANAGNRKARSNYFGFSVGYFLGGSKTKK